VTFVKSNIIPLLSMLKEVLCDLQVNESLKLFQIVILIVTISGDLHALTIQGILKKRGYADCHILEFDRISNGHKIYWHCNENDDSGYIKLDDGITIDIKSIDALWWRRVNADQQLDNNIADEHQIKLINNDCRGSVLGVLEASFLGKWLSSPGATARASNKIYQLSIAKRCGFRIPETLISQSQQEVYEFISQLNKQVIVKPVVGTAGPLMFTEFLNDPFRFDSRSYEVCPAVYQEYIPGTDHIRLNCFGNKSFAAIIETNDLDWRPNLNVPVKSWAVPDSLHNSIRNVLDNLGLEMGIIDLKITPEGEYVWLEVNPQGQFLFLEPLTNVPLSSYFADYLLDSIR